MDREPDTDAEIQEFCRTAYDVTFPVLAEVDVNGPEASPLFGFLRAEAPGDVAWNFTTFLVGRNGRVLRCYEPPVLPEEIAADLDELL